MKRCFTFVFAMGLMALITGCTEAPTDSHDADVKALKDNEAQWVKDFASKDVDKIVAHYADDAVLMGDGVPPASGKDAVRATIKIMVADPALSLKFEPARIEVSKSGDTASTQGSYTMTMTNPVTNKPMDDKGSYVTTYKKQADGSWKAVFDINATSMTPAAPLAK
jgi:uncharacterized protein (TIGR02246 family)